MGEALADRSDSADDRLALDAERRTASPYEGPAARCVGIFGHERVVRYVISP